MFVILPRMSRFSLAMIGWGALLAGCAAPGAGPTAGVRPPGPDCSACIEENPGDVRPCEKICHAPASDSAGPNAGGVIH